MKEPIKLDAYLATSMLFIVGAILLFFVMGVRFMNSTDVMRYSTLAVLVTGIVLPLILRARK